MLTKIVMNYPNPNCIVGDRLALYVLMEMLVEFKLITSGEMPIFASKLNNIHWNMKRVWYKKI